MNTLLSELSRFLNTAELKQIKIAVANMDLGKVNRRNQKDILFLLLKEVGWDDKKIEEFKNLRSREGRNSKKSLSPSFKFYKNKQLPKTKKAPFQGGSPGLGKKQ
jgi:hypothetical protein